MTWYQFIRQCLWKEAIRTELDSKKMIRAVLKEIKKWKKNK